MHSIKNRLFPFLGLLLLFIFAFTLTGCPMTKQQSNQPKPAPQNRKAVMEKINAVAERVEEVNNAYTILFGNTALVGVKLDKPTANKEEMIQVEKKVGQKVLQEVNVVKTVYTTAAPDAVNRIKTIAQKMGQGQPFSRFQKDVNSIIKDTQQPNR